MIYKASIQIKPVRPKNPWVRKVIVNASSVNEAKELIADWVLRVHNSYNFNITRLTALGEAVVEVS